MNLTPKQRSFLQLLEEGPVFASNRKHPGWATEEKLWLSGYVEVIGRSTYITDAGRAALEAEGARKETT